MAPDFALVSLDLDNSPKIERKAEPAQAKDKASKKSPPEQERERPAAASPKDVAPEGKEKKKKEKKQPAEKNETAAKAPTKAAADDSGPPVPSMIDLRVGKIVEGVPSSMVMIMNNTDLKRIVMKHPDADGLYVEV